MLVLMKQRLYNLRVAHCCLGSGHSERREKVENTVTKVVTQYCAGIPRKCIQERATLPN